MAAFRSLLFVEMDGLLGGELFAVVAAKFEVLLINNVELGGDCFGVSDALGVGTFYKILDMVGNLGGELLNNLVVLDGDDGYERSHEGHFAHLFLSKVLVLDFDDAFAAQFAAFEVVADENLVLIVFEVEDMDDLIDGLCGDMIYDCAVFDGRDNEFFLVFHDDEIINLYII